MSKSETAVVERALPCGARDLLADNARQGDAANAADHILKDPPIFFVQVAVHEARTIVGFPFHGLRKGAVVGSAQYLLVRPESK